MTECSERYHDGSSYDSAASESDDDRRSSKRFCERQSNALSGVATASAESERRLRRRVRCKRRQDVRGRRAASRADIERHDALIGALDLLCERVERMHEVVSALDRCVTLPRASSISDSTECSYTYMPSSPTSPRFSEQFDDAIGATPWRSPERTKNDRWQEERECLQTSADTAGKRTCKGARSKEQPCALIARTRAASREQSASPLLFSGQELRRAALLNNSPRRTPHSQQVERNTGYSVVGIDSDDAAAANDLGEEGRSDGARGVGARRRRREPLLSPVAARRPASLGELQRSVSRSSDLCAWTSSPPRSPRSLTNSPRLALSLGNNNSPRRFLIQTASRRINLAEESILLRRPLGYGGSATVYEADVAGFVIAAKIFHQHFGTDEALDAHRYLLSRKLDALCSLPCHQHIVSTLGYRFERSARLVVLSERMDDITLRDLIDARRVLQQQKQQPLPSGAAAPEQQTLQQPPFRRDEILGLFEQVVAGVAFLHHLPERCAVESGGHVIGVWHRDIKAENVFVKRVIAPLSEALSDDHFGSSGSSGRMSRSTSATNCASLQSNGSECAGAPADIVNTAGQHSSVELAQSGALHRVVQLKLGDMDEAHIVYDINSAQSPIQWLDSALLEHEAREMHTRRTAARDDNDSPASATRAVPNNLTPSAMATSGRVRRSSLFDSILSKTIGSAAGGSRARGSMVERLSLTVGTPEFMAPEMADRNSTMYGERVDVWSLGMLLYEMLTLQLPYDSDNYGDFELLTAIANGVRPSFPSDAYYNDRKFADEWRPVLDLFIACTQLDPTRRPSAAALLQQVRALQQAEYSASEVSVEVPDGLYAATVDRAANKGSSRRARADAKTIVHAVTQE